MKSSQFSKPRVVRAVRESLEALQLDEFIDVQETATYVADLWQSTLLAHRHIDISTIFSAQKKPNPQKKRTAIGPVVLHNLGFFLICPHHLTIAFGEATIAYCPASQPQPFGRFAKLVQAVTSRPITQEDATKHLAQSVCDYAKAQSAIVVTRAVHPCLNVKHPRAHAAQTTCLASAGTASQLPMLRSLLLQTEGPTRKKNARRIGHR